MDKAICSMKSGLGFTRGCHVQTVPWITMSGTRYVTEKVGNRNLCRWVRQEKGIDPFYRWFMPAINGFELWLDHGIIALFWRMDEFVESFERQKYYYANYRKGKQINVNHYSNILRWTIIFAIISRSISRSWY